MEDKLTFTPKEIHEAKTIRYHLLDTVGHAMTTDDEVMVEEFIRHGIENGMLKRDVFGLNPVLTSLQTAQIAVDDMCMGRDGVLATLLDRKSVV